MNPLTLTKFNKDHIYSLFFKNLHLKNLGEISITFPFLIFLFVVFSLNFFSSCAILRVPEYKQTQYGTKISEKRSKIVFDAETFLGRKFIKINGKSFPNDCSGLVAAIYYTNGYDLLEEDPPENQNLVKTIYNFVKANGLIYKETFPNPGDIVFFNNTHKTSSLNNLSHIGIVESVSADGTVVFIHKSSRGIKRDYLNLKEPSTRNDPDNRGIINSYLRRKSSNDPPGSKYLAGELFESFGNIIDANQSENQKNSSQPDQN